MRLTLDELQAIFEALVYTEEISGQGGDITDEHSAERESAMKKVVLEIQKRKAKKANP